MLSHWPIAGSGAVASRAATTDAIGKCGTSSVAETREGVAVAVKAAGASVSTFPGACAAATAVGRADDVVAAAGKVVTEGAGVNDSTDVHEGGAVAIVVAGDVEVGGA